MQRSARTAHTIRPSRSGSSTMQPATGQAAWQIEHANAPKQRSGSMTAIVFGAFLRGPDIILVHMFRDYTGGSGLGASSSKPRLTGRLADWPTGDYRWSGWPVSGSLPSGIVANSEAVSSQMTLAALLAKYRALLIT